MQNILTGMDIYKNIKIIAKKKNIQQKDIAEAFGVTEQTMTNYLVGRTKITADQIPMFAKALRVSIEQLFQEVGTPLRGDYKSDEKLNAIEEPVPCTLCATKDKLITSYEKQIALLESSMADKEQMLAGKERHINTLNKRIEEILHNDKKESMHESGKKVG